MVHKSADNAFAVVGILITEGDENQALASVWANMPTEKSELASIDATVDAAVLLPAQTTTYRYTGSLTTPPCTEGVNWFVMTDQMSLSAEQITFFDNIFHDDHRPTQPLGTRELHVDTTP